jgi:hypothetical protein
MCTKSSNVVCSFSPGQHDSKERLVRLLVKEEWQGKYGPGIDRGLCWISTHHKHGQDVCARGIGLIRYCIDNTLS